jgi:hypothetical protein
MDKILAQVKSAVTEWQKVAGEIGISLGEQALIGSAFLV